MTEKVNLAAKLATFDETWVPKVVGELNGQFVKVAKFEGAYVWHHHEHEDEMFLVVEGQLRLEIREPDRGEHAIDVGPGEFCVVPRGVEHRPVARELVHCVLFEPAATRNTGNVDHEFTIEAAKLEKI